MRAAGERAVFQFLGRFERQTFVRRNVGVARNQFECHAASAVTLCAVAGPQSQQTIAMQVVYAGIVVGGVIEIEPVPVRGKLECAGRKGLA